MNFTGDSGQVIQLMAYNSEIEPFNYPTGGGLGNVYWNPPLQDNYDVSDFEIMTFNIGDTTASPVTSYNTNLTSIDLIPESLAVNVGSPREFELAPPVGAGGFTINGLTFDPMRIDDTIALGSTEIWDITNIATMAHPFHIHGNSFQIISRTNGWRGLNPWELGWKDVVVVHSGETVRIIKKFEDYSDPAAPYMSHCHILEHEDAGMMTHWVVVDPSSGIEEKVNLEEKEFEIYPNPSNGEFKFRLNKDQEGVYTINLYNQNGQLVQKLLEGELLLSGEHQYSVDLENFPPGLYYCQFLARDRVVTRKLLLFKLPNF